MATQVKWTSVRYLVKDKDKEVGRFTIVGLVPPDETVKCVQDLGRDFRLFEMDLPSLYNVLKKTEVTGRCVAQGYEFTLIFDLGPSKTHNIFDYFRIRGIDTQPEVVLKDGGED